MSMHFWHLHTHDILLFDMEVDFSHRDSKNLFYHEVTFQGFRQYKILHVTNQSCFNFLAKAVVFANSFNETTHQFISLILEKFMTASSCSQALFQVVQLHSGWFDI